jgi:hypothetical protein
LRPPSLHGLAKTMRALCMRFSLARLPFCFFGDKKDASIANLFMSEFTSNFKEFYPSRF